MKKAVVVIPTYNEAGSINAIIDEIVGKISPAMDGWEVSILVVDGRSPDGTADIVKKSAARHPGLVHLIEEQVRGGIGAAYRLGFKHAIDGLGADAIIEFDGDLQHPPSYIPLLLGKLDSGFDYVVASRNIKGGSEPAGRGIFRTMLTSIGGLAARFLLFFPSADFWKVTDPTTGLKATRVAGFADRLSLDMPDLKSTGFGYKIQWLAETIRMGAKYGEIPLKFENRQAGQSKFSTGVIVDILRTCIAVRLSDPWVRRFAKYAIVGFAGYVVNAVFLHAIYSASGSEILSWTLSTEAAILSNFTFNNIWTFGDRRFNRLGSWLTGLARFNVSSLGALAISGIFGPVLTTAFGGSYRQIVLAFVVVFLVVPYNWFMYNRLIWKRPE